MLAKEISPLPVILHRNPGRAKEAALIGRAWVGFQTRNKDLGLCEIAG